MIAQLNNLLCALCACIQNGAGTEAADQVSKRLVEALFDRAGIDSALIDRAMVARAVSPAPAAVSVASGPFAVSISWRMAEAEQPQAVGRALERAEMLRASEACMKSAEVYQCLVDAGFDDSQGARVVLQEALRMRAPESGCVIPGILGHAMTVDGRVAGVAVLDTACLRARLASPPIRTVAVKVYHDSLGGRAGELVKSHRPAEALKLLDEALSVEDLPPQWRLLEIRAAFLVGERQRVARKMAVLLADPKVRSSGLGIEECSELLGFATELKDESLAAASYELALWSLGFDSSIQVRADDFLPSEARTAPDSTVQSAPH